MATIAVDSVLHKLISLAGDEIANLWGVEDQIVSLRRTFEWLQAFLKDADQKRRDRNNVLIGVWVNQLRDIAYDTEDVLDEFALKLDLQRLGYTCYMTCLHSLTPPRLFGRYDIANRIDSIKLRLEQVSQNRSQLLLADHASSSSSSSSIFDFMALRYEMEEDVVGICKDVTKLKAQLIDPNKPQLVVISVLGMGGIGKTTLANKVYRDREVINHFDYRVWIFASQVQNIRGLLRTMLKDIAGLLYNETATMKKQELIDRFLEHLRNKTYLVVLDDIWDNAVWDSLKAAFPQEITKSRVLLTTRKEGVARHANPDSQPFEMRLLSPEEDWSLFCKKAFQNGTCPEHLLALKEDILQRTSGLPLATVMLGGLLRRKTHITDSYNEWIKELKLISVIHKEENQIKRILYLSYDDLPHQLKPCFLYFAAFRDDSDIYAIDLKHMWIAEGFIQHGHLLDLTLEEIADSYLRELIQRCMIQLKKTDADGSIVSVRIHALLLELACSEAQNVNFLQINDSENYLPPSPSILRRLSVHNGMQNYVQFSSSSSISQLRSMIFMHPHRIDIPKGFQMNGVILLRVLDLQNLVMDSLPLDIGKMVQLRFLNLRFTKLKALPSTIRNLHHLQTLNLVGTEISKVPYALWKIKSLRHVFFDIDYFISMPKLVSNLNDLQTLDWVPGGSWICEIGKLKNLRSLSMHHITDSDEEPLLSALSQLRHLSLLNLKGESLPASIFTASGNLQLQTLFLWGPLQNRSVDPLFKSHQLLPNLKKLSVWQSNLVPYDLLMLSALPSLKYLQLLDASDQMELLFQAGGFPCLENLVVARMYELEVLLVDHGAMPCLTSLIIAGCDKMTMLPDGLRHLGALNVLKIAEMPLIQERMEKEDHAKIQHVESIFYYETYNLDLI